MRALQSATDPRDFFLPYEGADEWSDGRKELVFGEFELRGLVIEIGRETDNLEQHDPLGSVAFSPDGRILAVIDIAEDEDRLFLWDVVERKQLGPPLRVRREVSSPGRSMSFSPDGRTIASAGTDENVRQWDVRTHKQLGQPLQTGRAVNGPIVPVAPQPGEVEWRESGGENGASRDLGVTGYFHDRDLNDRWVRIAHFHAVSWLPVVSAPDG